MSETEELDAGGFSAWLTEIQGAIRGDNSSNVACGTCTACCTSSQFIHIGPEETDTLSHIPAAVVFPATRMPKGHMLMGYNQHGHCPMLIDNQCSIYQHRPRACRTYDCRVFPATGVPADDDKPLIAAQAVRWRFSYASDQARDAHAALVEAAAGDSESVNATQRAVKAVRRASSEIREH